MLTGKYGIAAIGLAMTVGLSGAAAEAAERSAKPSGDWVYTLGVGAMYDAVYDGSDTYKVQPLPIIAANYKDWLTISTLEGIQATYKINKRFYVRGGVGIDMGRDVDDDNDIKSFSSIKPTAMGQLALGAEQGDFFVEVNGGQDLLGEHKGGLVTFKAGIDKKRIGTSKWSYKLEGSMTMATKKYMSAYYGVTATEATLSGLNAYTAEGGFKDMSGSLTIGYAINPRTRVNTVLGGTVMMDKAKDSPLVATVGDKTNFKGGVFVTYSF